VALINRFEANPLKLWVSDNRMSKQAYVTVLL